MVIVPLGDAKLDGELDTLGVIVAVRVGVRVLVELIVGVLVRVAVGVGVRDFDGLTVGVRDAYSDFCTRQHAGSVSVHDAGRKSPESIFTHVPVRLAGGITPFSQLDGDERIKVVAIPGVFQLQPALPTASSSPIQ